MDRVKQFRGHYDFRTFAVIVGLMLAAIALFMIYLWHFNGVATKGYDLRRVESAHEQLLSQYEIRNMRLAEIKSMNNIIEAGKLEGMRRPVSVTFVKGTTVLASR